MKNLNLLALWLVLISPILSGAKISSDAKTTHFRTADYSYKISDFLTAIDRLPEKNIPKGLSVLPSKFRSSYVLMHNSGSLQSGSYSDPRAIMFTPTANLVISFNGHSNQDGGNRIEAMEFNSQAQTYDFHEITFTLGHYVHSKNPAKCMNCHTQYRIPNWRTYGIWNGSFDSFDIGEAQSRYEPFAQQPTNPIHKFHAFLAQQPNHPRYQNLVRPKDEPLWPFRKNFQLAHDSYDHNPARRLGIGLMFHQARTIADKISKTELFRDYPANIISELLNCAQPDLLVNTITFPYSSVGWQQTEFQRKILTLIERSPLFATAEEITKTTSSVYNSSQVVAQLLAVSGLRPEIWAHHISDRSNRILSNRDDQFIGMYDMARLPDVVSTILMEKANLRAKLAIAPIGPSEDVANGTLVPIEVLRELHKIAPLYSRKQLETVVCPKLKVETDNEIAANRAIRMTLSAADQAVVGSKKPYALRYCIACHAGDNYSSAPHIPFSQESKLKPLMRDLLGKIETRIHWETRDSNRMPKGPTNLHPGLAEELMNYFRNLAAH